MANRHPVKRAASGSWRQRLEAVLAWGSGRGPSPEGPSVRAMRILGAVLLVLVVGLVGLPLVSGISSEGLTMVGLLGLGGAAGTVGLLRHQQRQAHHRAQRILQSLPGFRAISGTAPAPFLGGDAEPFVVERWFEVGRVRVAYREHLPELPVEIWFQPPVPLPFSLRLGVGAPQPTNAPSVPSPMLSLPPVSPSETATSRLGLPESETLTPGLELPTDTGDVTFDGVCWSDTSLSLPARLALTAPARAALVALQARFPHLTRLTPDGVRMGLPPEFLQPYRLETVLQAISHAVQSLKIKPDPLDAALEAFGAEPNPVVRRTLLTEFCALPVTEPVRRAVLKRSLSDGDWGVRLQAVEALGAGGQEALSRFAQEAPPEWMGKVVQRLGALGSPEALAVLREVLPRPDVGLMAAEMLGAAGDSASVPALVAQLRLSPHPDVARRYALILKPFGDVRASDALVERLEALDDPVALEALCEALSTSGDEGAMVALLSLTRRSRGTLQQAAQQAFDVLTKKYGPLEPGRLSLTLPNDGGRLSLTEPSTEGALSMVEPGADDAPVSPPAESPLPDAAVEAGTRRRRQAASES